MLMSERIAQLIEEMLNEQDGSAEISRNDFASQLGCVPSQISYVISSRFNSQRGYIVESRRGGGGYIRITRVQMDKSRYLMHLLGAVGDCLDAASAKALLVSLFENSILDEKQLKLYVSLLSDNTLSAVDDRDTRDHLRAELFKTIILHSV